MLSPRTLFDKIWRQHVVFQEAEAPAALYIDQHYIHEVTSPQAFEALRNRGLKVRRLDKTTGATDHSTPTTGMSMDLVDEQARRQVAQMHQNCREFSVPLYDLDHEQHGIVHVIGPELGLTRPGMTIVCGDSHTATHGAFGALAFGIGTSEVEHVLATQCLLQERPKTCLVSFTGRLGTGVTAKDVILGLIASIGTGGGTGYVFEYSGEAVRAMSMEERMTLCNMSIEAGARAGMVAPDETTYQYLAGRQFAPQGEAWEKALATWKTLPSDAGAVYDRQITFDLSALEPMVTYGTNPGMGAWISQRVPDPAEETDETKRRMLEKALRYMDLQPGQPLAGQPVDVVFIGSCTNGRLSDLRQAAALLKGRKVSERVRLVVVPGSESVRRQAEAEGLDQVIKAAGGEWHFPGCSMCLAMNGDGLLPGQYAVSTSNRNFEGRQGPNGRTFLASPLTAAVAAISGCLSDPRQLL